MLEFNLVSAIIKAEIRGTHPKDAPPIQVQGEMKMNIIDIYNEDARQLQDDLMFQVAGGDPAELHNGLIVAVKLICALQKQINNLDESVNVLRKIIVDRDETK